jgi:acyl-CoA thioesterase I
MKKHIRATFFHPLWTLLLVVAFIAAACTTTTITSHISSVATPPLPTVTVHLSTGPITYAALGASDAVGVGSNQPGSQGYVPLLAARLPKGSHLINLGISGIHLHEALIQEVPLALALSPGLITIWLVANDFVGNVPYSSYMHDLNTLLTELHSETRASLVMANLPDLTRLPAFANQTSTQKAQMLTQIERWNAGIATAAAHYSVALVDLFSHGSQLTAHPEYISGDGFHPSPLGYVQLADLFWWVMGG